MLLQVLVRDNGSAAKILIAMPSGTDSLDRVAIAGIAASNPFPPLPPGFKGNELQLEFAFAYNMQ